MIRHGPFYFHHVGLGVQLPPLYAERRFNLAMLPVRLYDVLVDVDAS